jgi:hypothetical protein
MKRKTKYAAMGAASLMLAGCQSWGPTWSELMGTRYSDITSMTEMPVVVTMVDGTSPGTRPLEAIKVTPGPHKLVLQATAPPGVTGLLALEQTEVDFKPCVRYYVNARFASSTSDNWRPFIDREEKIPGCQLPTPPKS